MLEKDTLRNTRTLKATPKMIKIVYTNAIDKNGTNHYGCKTHLKYKYKYLLRCQSFKGHLKIALFVPEKILKGITTPINEIFINKETGENITRVLDDNYQEVRWSRAFIGNTEENYNYSDYNEWHCQHIAYINPEGLSQIRKLGNCKDPFKCIYDFQKNARKKKQDAKEKKLLDEWDHDMSLVPEPPKDIEEWVHKNIIRDHFVFYDKEKKSCYCTYCRKDMELEKRLPQMKEIYKHNNKYKCYSCGKKVIMKNVNVMSQIIQTHRFYYSLISKLNDNSGIVIRTFEVQHIFKKDDFRNPFKKVEEYKRVLYDGIALRPYIYELYKQSYNRWVLEKDTYFYGSYTLYKKNLRSIKSSIGKKSAIIEYIRSGRSGLYRFLRQEIETPFIEKVVKAGMLELAEDIMSYGRYRNILGFNEKESELAKILGIDKNRLARFRKMSVQDCMTLAWLQDEKKNNTVYDDELIQDMSKARLLPDSFKELNGKMTYRQIYNYLLKQNEPDETLSQTYRTWFDYLNMAQKIGMNLDSEQVYKPKDLKAAHDRCVKIKQQAGMKETASKLEKEWPSANDIIKTLKKYEYKGEKYSVVAPESIYDIVVEGTILGHCVHSCDYYFDRIQRQESYILFLRFSEREDVPYYTLEVEPSGNIRQKRTTGDNQNKDFEKAIDFLKEWQQVITERLSEEDKKLGKKSDELRKKNYAELRKKGNKVWHGRLAGKLLADVLENDFMAAI